MVLYTVTSTYYEYDKSKPENKNNNNNDNNKKNQKQTIVKSVYWCLSALFFLFIYFQLSIVNNHNPQLYACCYINVISRDFFFFFFFVVFTYVFYSIVMDQVFMHYHKIVTMQLVCNVFIDMKRNENNHCQKQSMCLYLIVFFLVNFTCIHFNQMIVFLQYNKEFK